MFKRYLILLAMTLTILAGGTFAQTRQKIQGYCEDGGQTVTTDGRTSTTKVQRSYPSCTVTVYDGGTTTLSTIYSDESGTPKANPFVADANGGWSFYGGVGRYDTKFSGGGITTPFTRSGWWVVVPGGGGGGSLSGSGTADRIAKWSGTSTLSNSIIGQTGTSEIYLLNGRWNLKSNTQQVIEVSNEGTTGTTQNYLAKLTGAPSTAVLIGTGDTSGIVGIVVAGAGTVGSAQIGIAGTFACTFDGGTTAGNYVVPSITNAGQCADGGSSPPGKQIIGRVLSTNASAGTYDVLLFGPGGYSATGGTASINPGSTNQLGYYAGAGNTLSPLSINSVDFRISGGTLSQKNTRKAINLMDYGADPTGSSSSDSAISSWLGVCTSSYEYSCYAPGGLYKYTTSFTTSINGLYLVGDGRSQTVFYTTSANTPFLNITTANYAVNFVIDGIGFQGAGKTSGSSGHCVYINDATSGTAQFLIQNSSFTNCGGKGVYIPKMFAGTFRNNLFDEIGDNMLEIEGGSATLVERNDFKTVAAGKAALRIYSGNSAVVNNNGIEPDSGSGAVWAIFGQSVAGGDGTDTYWRGTFNNNNVESFPSKGIIFRTNSGASEMQANSFISPTSGSVMAIQYESVAGTEQAVFGSTNSFTLQGTATWANSEPIHASGAVPFFVTGTNAITTFWHDTAAEQRTVPYVYGKLLAGTTNNPLYISELQSPAFRVLPGGTSSGQGGTLNLHELAANGQNVTGFKAPDALAADVVYTLPSADGTSGQVLQTNGSKVLSWVTAGGGGGTVTGSGAAGQVTYWTGASAVSGTNNHYWDNTNARLGINIGTSPSTPLHVLADTSNLGVRVKANAATLNVDLSSDGTVGFLGTTTNHPFEVWTNSTTRIRVDAAGTVGINQAAPGAQLHVTSGASGTIAGIVASAASPSVDIFDVRQNATNVWQVRSDGTVVHTPTVRTSGSQTQRQFITPADTTLTASTEAIGTQIGGNSSAATVTRQFSTGAITTQRENVFVHPTYSAVAATTITNAATVAITNAPAPGTNVTITNPFALQIQAGNLGLDASLSALVFGSDTYLKRYAASTVGFQNNSGTTYVAVGSGGVQTFLNGSSSFPSYNLNSILGMWVNGSSQGVIGPIGTTDYLTFATNGPQINSPVTTGSGTTSGTVFNYNSLTSGVGALFTSSSISSGSLVRIVSTSTAAASSTLKGLDIAISGANGMTAQTVTGASISVTNTNATSGTNIALSATASGATTANYAAVLTGFVAIGGTTSTFTGLRNNSTSLEARLADNSDYAKFRMGAFESYDSGSNAKIVRSGTTTFGLGQDVIIAWADNASYFAGTNSVILRRAAAANLALGAADAASPVAQTLSVQNVVAGTSNTAGANWTFAGSRGTGTGAGGAIIWQIAPAGSSGTSQNALVETMRLDGNGIRLPEISSAATPATNNVYLYAKDKTGVSTLYYKKDDGTEVEIGSGGSGTPGGSNTQIQYNNAGSFGGISGLTTNGSTTLVQTSSNAAAFESGPNGSTNPVFRLVNNVVSAATGLSITGNAAGSGVTLAALSSGANEFITLTPKGTGVNVLAGNSNSDFLSVGANNYYWSIGSGPSLVISGAINRIVTYLSIQTRAAKPVIVTGSTGMYGWGSWNNFAESSDLGLVRAAAGVMRINDGATSGNPNSTSGSLLIAPSSVTAAAQLHVATSNATTAAVTNQAILEALSSGTPAAGFGPGLEFRAQSSTTAGRTIAQLNATWSDATDASRTTNLQVTTINNAGSVTTVGGWQAAQTYGAAENNIGNSSASTTVNWNNGNHQKLTLIGNVTTLTFSNMKPGTFYVLQLIQDATGGRNVAKPSNVIIPGGASGGNITGLTGTANAVDELWCRSNGTTATCFVVADVKN